MAEQNDPPDADARWTARLRAWIRRLLLALGTFTALLIIFGGGACFWLGHHGRARASEVLSELQGENLPTETSALSYAPENVKDAREAASYLVAAGEIAKQGPMAPYFGEDAPRIELGAAIDAGLAADLERYTRRYEIVYRLLRLGRGRDAYYYDLQFNRPDGRAGEIVSGVRVAARKLKALSLYHQSQGRGEEALDACIGMLEISRSLRQEPYQFTWLNRAAINSRAMEQAEQVLSRTMPEISELRKAKSIFGAAAGTFDVRSALKGEIALAAENMRQPRTAGALWHWKAVRALESGAYAEAKRRYREGYKLLPGLSTLHREDPLPSETVYRWQTRLNHLILLVCPDAVRTGTVNEISLYLGFYRASLKSDRPLLAAARAAIPPEDREVSESIREMAEAAEARFVVEMLAAKARMQITALALGAEIHYRQRGSWPSDLAELGQNPVQDPLGKGEFKYKSTENGRVIYSVGHDGKDGGGDDLNDIAFRLFAR